MNLANHPCFNEKVRMEYGRVHLPVAPGCNMQCNFCNRLYDCANENRPGVTSAVLSSHQALVYLDKVLERNKNISVVGIAGPGDPFANPEETCQTLRLVREKYAGIILCVATNGLNLLPYLDFLIELKVSHVSITVNAVDPEIGEKIYAWMRDGKNIYRGKKAAELLLERQLTAIKALKEHGIVVKVNSILIPEVNVAHVQDIARTVASYGADIINPMPLYPVKGTMFHDVSEISLETIYRIRKEVAEFLPVMTHCSRCRADAVGLLGEELDTAAFSLLRSCTSLPLKPRENRAYVAVASHEGMLVNLHLGEAEQLYVYKQEGDEYLLVEVRKTPLFGGGNQRWMDLAALFKDCRAILVSKAGRNPSQVLNNAGIKIIEMEGLIEEGLEAVFGGKDIPAALQPSSCDNCALIESGQDCRCSGEMSLECG